MSEVHDERDGPPIEITPEMIEAGADLIMEWDTDYYDGPYRSPSALAAELFKRMACKSSSPFGLKPGNEILDVINESAFFS